MKVFWFHWSKNICKCSNLLCCVTCIKKPAFDYKIPKISRFLEFRIRFVQVISNSWKYRKPWYVEFVPLAFLTWKIYIGRQIAHIISFSLAKNGFMITAKYYGLSIIVSYHPYCFVTLCLVEVIQLSLFSMNFCFYFQVYCIRSPYLLILAMN